ncbi:unnamed protein product [Scytosiphon promiscuus]
MEDVSGGRRVVSQRPNIVRKTVKPSTKDEIDLAAEVIAKAKAAHPARPWHEILDVAVVRYNVEVAKNTASAGNSTAVSTKGLLGMTTLDLMREFWEEKSRYASGPLHVAAHGHGGGAAGRAIGAGGGTPRSGMVSKQIKLYGEARAGKVFVMTEAEIDTLTNRRRLTATIRSLEGCTCASALKAPELRNLLKQAIKDGKRRKLGS